MNIFWNKGKQSELRVIVWTIILKYVQIARCILSKLQIMI